MPKTGPDGWVRGEGGAALYREGTEGIKRGPALASQLAERARQAQGRQLEAAKRQQQSQQRSQGRER
jgi:hypothetical protein